MNEFLKSKRLYMLFVLPFWVLALTFINSYLPTETVNVAETERGMVFALFHHLGRFGYAFVGGLMILGIVCLIFFIHERFKLLQQTTTLPVFIYVLLISGIIMNEGFGDILVAVFILTLAMDRLQLAITNIRSNQILFDFGALVVLAVLVYPKFVFLIGWAFCASLFSGRSTLKDITALLLGFMTPVFFLLFYYFWTNRFGQLSEIFLNHLLAGNDLHDFSAMEWIRLSILLFVWLIALLHFFNRYSVLILIHRRIFFAFVSMFFFLALTFFLIPFQDKTLMYILALPLSFMYAQFFLTQRNGILGNFLFCLLVGACMLPFVF